MLLKVLFFFETLYISSNHKNGAKNRYFKTYIIPGIYGQSLLKWDTIIK